MWGRAEEIEGKKFERHSPGEEITQPLFRKKIGLYLPSHGEKLMESPYRGKNYMERVKKCNLTLTYSPPLDSHK